jgi:CubicO group peptidase (beta-lactamase class C family)
MKRILSTVIFTLACLAIGYVQTLDKAKLDLFFDRLAEKNKAMGSLVLAKDGQVLYARSIGYSQINGAEKQPLTAASGFRIGSVTKMFTATMIFQLIDKKKLHLSDTLGKFFPQIPNAGKITIEHILAHRSGIPGIADGSGKSKQRTQSEVLDIIINRTPDFEPGTKYAYSNSGYIILGYIIEKVTGKSYQEALEEMISTNAGLKDTYLGTGFTDAGKHESFSYGYFGAWKQMPATHLSTPAGAGAMISTPADLARFIRALFDLKLVSKQSLLQMKQDSLGMVPFTYNGHTSYGHTGGIDNFGAWLVYQPEEKLAMAYTSNAKVYPVGKIVDGVFDIYANKPFEVPTFEAVKVRQEVLDKYVGVYGIPGAPIKLRFTREGDTLFIQLPGESPFPLEAAAENEFKIEGAGMIFEFDTSKNQVTQKRGDRERVFTKENQ